MLNSVYLRLSILMLTLVLLIAIAMSQDAGGSQKDVIVLSDKNTVSLNVPIDGDSVRAVERELLAISDKLGASETIYLVLNTPGGSVGDGLELIELIKGLPQKVSTISLFSASMGFILSQYLGDRYVLENSSLMSHRAYVEGMQGSVPGTLNTRVNFVNEQLKDVEKAVAKRAGYPLNVYQDMIANELWLSGPDSVKLNFADKVVTARCDKSLRGSGSTRTVRLFIFQAKITYDKCPLITTPSLVIGDDYLVTLLQSDRAAQVRAFGNK